MKTITITFPSLSAKEIVDSCSNKVNGGKLLWNDWFAIEDFYTTGKTREGKREIYLTLEHKGKSWNEIDELKGENEMLNFAEVVYLLKESKEFRELLSSSNYTWTTTRLSGGYLVRVGFFDPDGAFVDYDDPGYSSFYLSVCFSRGIDKVQKKESIYTLPDEIILNGKKYKAV